MAYSGPTWVSTDEYVGMQARRFDELATTTDDPVAPLRVKVETDKFHELAASTPSPVDELRVSSEQRRFDELTADTPGPSSWLRAPAAPEPGPPPPAPPAPTGEPGPPPAAPAQEDDSPVGRALSFLRGLVPGAGTAAPPPPVDPGGESSPVDQQYPQPSAFTGLAQPEQLAAPAAPDPAEGPFAPDPVGRALDAGEGAFVDRMQSFRDQGATLGAAVEGQRRGAPPAEMDRLIAAAAAPGPLDEVAMNVAMASPGDVVGGAGKGLVDALGNPVRRAAEKVAILGPEGETLKNVRVPKIAPEMAAKPIMPEVTLPPQRVNPVRQLLDRSRNVIGSMGEGGQELAQRIHRWRDDAEVEAAGWIRRMPTVQTLSKNEMTNLVDVLERGRVGAAGDAVPMNARVQRAAGEAKEVLDEVYARAQNAGVDVGEKIESYFPHTFKRETIEGLRDATRQREVIKHLIGTGEAADEAEAAAIMHRFLTASRDRRHGALEMERLANLPGYEKTKEALYGHLLSSARRIHEVAQFGPDDAIANKLLDRIGAEGHDLDTARDLFQTIVGSKSYGELQERYAGLIRQYNTYTRLGLAAVGNVTQPFANTAPVVGILRTAMSYPKAIWSAADKDFALKAGATLDDVIRGVREGGGWSDRVPGIVMPGFSAVEKMNRTVTAVAGRDFAREMARKAQSGNRTALRALESMGLDAAAVAKRGVLTDDEEIAAARSIVERTQFRVDPQDLPGWASSPWGKVVAQFRTFGYNQTAYVGRELFAEAAKGNVAPLLRFAVAGTLANAAAIEARNAIQNRAPEEDPVKRAAQYVMGPLGVAGDVGRAVLPINSDRLTVDRQGSMIAGAVGGPSLGTLADLSVGAANALRGNWTPAARTALRQIPVVGTAAQNYVLPYEKQEPAAPSGSGRNSSRSSRTSGRSSGR